MLENIAKINQEVITKLNSNSNSSLKGSGRYRLIDVQGRAYSRFLGWHELDGKIYGHQFAKDEVSQVLEVLKENGFYAIRVEKDSVGSLFSLIGNSPFGHPKKMIELYFVTAIVALAAYISVKFDLVKFAKKFIETTQFFN